MIIYFSISQKTAKQTYQAPESDDEDGLGIVPNTASVESESISATLEKIVDKLAMVHSALL